MPEVKEVGEIEDVDYSKQIEKDIEVRRQEGQAILNGINKKYGEFLTMSALEGVYSDLGSQIDYSSRIVYIKFKKFPEDNKLLTDVFNDYSLGAMYYGLTIAEPIATLTDFDSKEVEIFGPKLLSRPNIFGTPGGTQALIAEFVDKRPVIAKMGVTGGRGVQMLGKIVQTFFGNKGIGEKNKIAIMSNYASALSQCARGLIPYIDSKHKKESVQTLGQEM